MSALPKIRSNESVPPGENTPSAWAAGDGLVGRTGRRSGERRNGSPDRALTVPGARFEQDGTLPASWPQMILAMLGALALAFTFSSDWPPIDSAVMLGSAVILVTLLRPIGRFTQQRGPAVRFGAVWAVALLPLLLFGMGLTRWAEAGGMDWELAMGGLLCVTCLASIYLRRQPILIFGAQLCTWLAVVAIHPSLAGWAQLAFTLALVVQVVRSQANDNRREEDQRQAAERVNSRARDILAEYEETRQGWFWETDRRGLLTYVSAPVAEVLGCRPAALIGQPLVRLLNLEVADPQCERTLQFHLSSRSAFKELAVQAAIPDDERWWSISGRPVYDGFHNFVGFRGSGTDLTERKRSQEQATRLAHFDSLTGLANRFQMSQSLEKILAAPREAGRACAVLLLDLDRFKHVNDTMGHPAGDSLLKQVAQRLERAVGKRGQVGRQGGDEFQVIMPGHVDKRVVADVASEIIRSLSQPYSIEGQRVIIGASVGVAMAPEDGVNSEALIRNADLALYAAKDGGRGRYHFFANDLHAEAEARAKLEEELRDAIHLGQLQLYYQPIVATATETISGFEALLRWQHPEKGWISPTKFVQIAEDSGLIGQIGEWALRTACHHLSTWPEEVRVAVNVSALQFASPQLPAIVTSAIAQAGISPSRLELEITESVFLSDDAGTDAMFAALKGIGVRLALDDFGTGYSSLGYLKRAPFDKIKIDQSFVRGATEPGSRNGAIIASITGLAHALGMDTTAEGVETMDELELVRMHGCSHIQGYIYERPLDPEAATQRLQTGLAAVARGPRSARSPRQTMLRRVVLDHHGHLYNGTIRNISISGALIEGLWNVPAGTMFVLHISDVHSVTATTRWCEDDKLGVEFDAALKRDPSGRISVIQGRTPKPVPAKTA